MSAVPAAAAAPYIVHVTLNSGSRRRIGLGEVGDDAILAARPLINREGLHRDAVPGFGLDLIVTRIGGGLYCTVARDGSDACAFAVASRSRGAPRLWREICGTTLDRYADNLDEPPQAPWLALALAAWLRSQPREVALCCIGLAKACAGSWITRGEIIRERSEIAVDR